MPKHSILLCSLRLKVWIKR
uniref:Uncharacterized protein n=1 Tax=Arundo donax TaxID=35708 RepID=A0A0A9FCM0_ARUDO